MIKHFCFLKIKEEKVFIYLMKDIDKQLYEFENLYNQCPLWVLVEEGRPMYEDSTMLYNNYSCVYCEPGGIYTQRLYKRNNYLKNNTNE